MVVFVATGALAGQPAVSTLVSGGVSAASEKYAANVEGDAKRTAKEIAQRLGVFFVGQGWIPASALQ